MFVENLSEHIVKSTEDIKALIRHGTQLRTTAATRSNTVRYIRNLNSFVLLDNFRKVAGVMHYLQLLWNMLSHLMMVEV